MIVEQAEQTGTTVVFAYEASVRIGCYAGTTWAPVGATPIVKGTGARLTVNMISAVAASGAFSFIYLPPTCNPAAFFTFLALLMATIAGPVTVIGERYSAHVARATEAFVDQHADSLAIYFQPGYSPMLNLNKEC